mgnify:CR=1 FL=1
MMRTALVAFGLLALNASILLGDDRASEDAHLGTWRQVAVVVDGKEVAVGPSTLLTVTREGYAVTVDGEPYQKGATKAHRTKSPVQSEVTVTEGARAGKSFGQISMIQGDVLIACLGVERPTEFKSKPGSGHTLSVWIRVN